VHPQVTKSLGGEIERRRRRPGPRRARKKNVSTTDAGSLLKEKILEVAINLFAERGFAGTRINDIGKIAGAEAPTIYHYFGDKKSLYRAACRACFSRRTRDTLRRQRSDEEPPLALYRHVLETCSSLIAERPFYMLIQRQLLELDGHEMRMFVEGSFEDSFRALLAIIKELKPHEEPWRMVVYIYSLIFGAARLTPLWETASWIHFPESREPAELAWLVVRLLFPDTDWSRYAPQITAS
jgi:AcrR family transcriptional regulator